MARVNVKVVGGDIQEMDLDSIRELRDELDVQNHVVSVNGRQSNNDTVIKDEDFIVFAPAVKGA